jgi:hypothetical protein
VLGNKCAGQYNLKRVHFKEALASGNFWYGHWQYVCFFAAFYLPQDDSSKRFCSDGEGDPLQAFLEGALGQQAPCQLWFHFQEKIKDSWCEIWWILELGEHIDAFSTASYWK